MKGREVVHLVLKKAFIVLVSIAGVGYLLSKCNAVEHAGALSADIKAVDCESKKSLFEFKDEFGIAGKSSIEKDGIVGRFDCSRTEFKIEVYHF